MKKLKYIEIYNMVKKGRIPDGYEIEWYPCEPGPSFNFEVKPENIKFTGNVPPMPDLVKIEEEYVPALGFFMNAYLFKKADFGKIRMRTEGKLKTFKFIYGTDREDGRQLMEWVCKHSESVTGRAPKKMDIVFDMEMNVGESSKLLIYNAFPREFEFKNNGNIEDICSLEVDLICDHWHLVI